MKRSLLRFKVKGRHDGAVGLQLLEVVSAGPQVQLQQLRVHAVQVFLRRHMHVTRSPATTNIAMNICIPMYVATFCLFALKGNKIRTW